MIIYKTVNKINGHYYIGKDEKNNPLYLGSGLALGRAIKKYGRENFSKEVLEECTDSDILAERERFWILYYNAVLDSNSYNIAYGGRGGNTGSYYKVGRSGKLNSQYGRKYTTEERQDQSNKIKNYHNNPANAKILADRYRRSSKTQKGRPKNPKSVAKNKASKIQYFQEYNIIRTIYILTSPEGNTYKFNGLHEITLWCKENGYSIWTVQRRLLKNIQPKSGTLVGWTATVESCFIKNRRSLPGGK